MSTKRLGLLKRHKGLPLREIAQKAHDERGGHAQFAPGPLDRPRQAADHCLEGHAPAGVQLWIKEDLRANDVLVAGPYQISPRDIEKILLGPQHGRGGVVDIQKALEVGEGKGLPHRRR